VKPQRKHPGKGGKDGANDRGAAIVGEKAALYPEKKRRSYFSGKGLERRRMSNQRHVKERGYLPQGNHLFARGKLKKGRLQKRKNFCFQVSLEKTLEGGSYICTGEFCSAKGGNCASCGGKRLGGKLRYWGGGGNSRYIGGKTCVEGGGAIS